MFSGSLQGLECIELQVAGAVYADKTLNKKMVAKETNYSQIARTVFNKIVLSALFLEKNVF